DCARFSRHGGARWNERTKEMTMNLHVQREWATHVARQLNTLDPRISAEVVFLPADTDFDRHAIKTTIADLSTPPRAVWSIRIRDDRPENPLKRRRLDAYESVCAENLEEIYRLPRSRYYGMVNRGPEAA